jgi:hypothetical protein
MRMLKRLKEIKKRLWQTRGLSLIDAVVSLFIMTITLLPLSMMSINNVKFAAKMSLSMKAAYFAQGVMDEIYADYESDGYSNFFNHWPKTLAYPEGFDGSQDFAVDSLNHIEYILATVTVTNPQIEDIMLTAMLIDDGN